jgi:hypothetical protein
MKKKPSILVLTLSLIFVCTACKKVEETRLVPQTVVVTRAVPKTMMAANIVQETPPNKSELVPPNCQESFNDIDPAYYDGIVVITQYYTFLGHGLYEEAYQLLSSAAQVYSLQDYIKNQKAAFKVVRIITVRPFYFQDNPYRSTSELKSNKWFSVAIYAEGEGGWSGSVPNGEQSFKVAITQENGVWKMDKWATGIAP